MKHLGDICKIDGRKIEPVDIVSFGSPCQGLSVAGKGLGLSDPRSGLFMEAVRIIREMREATNDKYPRFALWENVPGAFSSNKGEDFRAVLEELIKVIEPDAVMPAVPKKGWAYADHYSGDGWSIAYRVLDTQYWPRTPQRRKRIYLVADFGGQSAGEILFKSAGLRGDYPSCGATWQGTSTDAESGAGADDNGEAIGVDTYNATTTGDVSATLGVNCGMSTGRNGVIEFTPVCYGISSYESNAMKSNNLHSGIYKATISRTLDSNGGNPACNQGGIAVVEPKGYLASEKNVVGTLQAGPAQRGFSGSQEILSGDYHIIEEHKAPAHYIVRRLTPTECARLQGFPDHWGHPQKKESLTEEEYQFWTEVRNTHATINGKTTRDYTEAQMLAWYNKLHTDSAEYKMWGNGIALPCALYVMQGIADALEGINDEISEEENQCEE